jgi:hypothetical protein
MLNKLIFTMFVSTAAMTACVADEDAARPTETAQAIRSADDLDAYVRATTRSPLDRLSPLAKQRFLDSLVFGDTGLGGFQYSDLEAELTPDEIQQILGLFAMERATSLITGETDKAQDLRQAEDHLHFYCEGTGTCAPKIGYICTSRC